MREQLIISKTISQQGNAIIITYHDVLTNSDNKFYYTKPDKFIKQIMYFKKNNYEFLTLSELYNKIINNIPLHKKTVVITFDGPYISWFNYVCPILKEHDIKATFFVITSWVNTPGSITWQDFQGIKEYKNNAGTQLFDIQSHSDKHTSFMPLKSEDFKTFSNRINDELLASKTKLDNNLNQETLYFALPYSRGMSNEMLDNIKCSGYLGVRTNRNSLISIKHDVLIFISQYSDFYLRSYMNFLYSINHFKTNIFLNYLLWFFVIVERAYIKIKYLRFKKKTQKTNGKN